MKSNRGQNVRLVSLFRRFFVVTSLLHSVVSSTNFLNFAFFSCHFVASSCRLVTPLSSFSCFDLSLDSWLSETNSVKERNEEARERIIYITLSICVMSSLHSHSHQSVRFRG